MSSILNMIISDIKYYFSIPMLTFATLFIATIVAFVISLFLMFYKDGLTYAIISLAPLVVIIIGLPDYLRFMYCALTKKSALELTKNFLINNSKGDTYKWVDIKDIVYKRFTGPKSPPGGYI